MMAQADLLTLAEKYVRLSNKLETVRGEIRNCVLANGLGVDPDPPSPVRATPAGNRPGKASKLASKAKPSRAEGPSDARALGGERGGREA
jgi:hypothetical protein